MSNSESSTGDGPRIIVDEDWKTQVEREREALRTHSDSPNDPKHRPAGRVERFPPATLSGMIGMFASQAMAALGLLPDPMTGETERNQPLAKFLIDTLALLEQKTEGNRTEEESGELRDALHHLRMIFVTSSTTQPNPPGKSESPIELA